MIALFAMIAFVTNLCTPMATIIKNQGEISNALAQIGNIGNFIAYLVMGIPAGMLISKYGYKKTALIGLAIGIVGILIQWCSVVAATKATSSFRLVACSTAQLPLLATSSWVRSSLMLPKQRLPMPHRHSGLHSPSLPLPSSSSSSPR